MKAKAETDGGRKPAATRRRRTGGYAPEETRRALLASALQLFESKGYHATAVDEIVEHAGLTKGAFYHHFESKEDLLRLIHDDYLDATLTRARAVLHRPGTATDQLRELIQGAIVDIERFRSNVAVYLQEGRFLTGDRLDAVRVKRDEVDALYTSVIKRGIESGEFSADLNPRLVNFAIVGMCAWVVRWYRPGQAMSARKIADHYARMVIDGLKPGPG